MDGRRRNLDNIFAETHWRNVKYGNVHPEDYSFIFELTVGLGDYFAFYNEERSHQSLDYQTPDVVDTNCQGSGVSILEHFSDPLSSRRS